MNKRIAVAATHSARGARGRGGRADGVESGRDNVLSRGEPYAAHDSKAVGQRSAEYRRRHMVRRGGFNYENRPLGPLKSVLPTRATHITVC